MLGIHGITRCVGGSGGAAGWGGGVHVVHVGGSTQRREAVPEGKVGQRYLGQRVRAMGDGSSSGIEARRSHWVGGGAG